MPKSRAGRPAAHAVVFESLEEALAKYSKAPKTRRKYEVVWEALEKDPDLTNRELDSILKNAGLSRDTKVTRNTRASLRKSIKRTRMARFIQARESSQAFLNSDVPEPSFLDYKSDASIRKHVEALEALVKSDPEISFLEFRAERRRGAEGVSVVARITKSVSTQLLE